MKQRLTFSLRGLNKKTLAVLGLLALGLMLLLFSGSGKTAEPASPDPGTLATDEAEECARALEELLSRTAGVGKARVLLTLASGSRTVYARETETREETGPGSVSSEEKSALASVGSSSAARPVTEQVEGPVYRGAVVVCAGGDRADVRLAVTQAVMAATGLSSDRISVLALQQ